MSKAYKGLVYLAPSGQWAFRFYQNELELGGGSGFDSEKAAVLGCLDALSDQDEQEPVIEVVKFQQLPSRI